MRASLGRTYLHNFLSGGAEFEKRMLKQLQHLEETLIAVQNGSAHEHELLIEFTVLMLLYASALPLSTLAILYSPRRKQLRKAALKPILKEAREGNIDADRSLRLLACDLIRTGKPIPEVLREYVCRALLGERPKFKQGRSKQMERNRCIVYAVENVIQDGTSVDKACWIVSKALARLQQGVSKDAVAKVWIRSSPARMLTAEKAA